MTIDNLNTLNYPIETELAKKFWASKHKCNKVKSIIAFSLNLDNANDNLRRYGYTLSWRKKAIRHFGKYVSQPAMDGIPFSELSTPWWECMGQDPTPPPPFVVLWMDSMNWQDAMTWDKPYSTRGYTGDDTCKTC